MRKIKLGDRVVFTYICPEGHTPILKTGCHYWGIYIGNGRVAVNLPKIHAQFIIYMGEENIEKAEKDIGER